jgi:kynureninase
VAVVAGASEGLSQVTALLEPDQGTILLVGSDFPSVTYPWLAAAERRGISLRFVDDRADRDLTQDLVEAIDLATVVVAFSVVQYATGTRVDAGRVAERAHEVGARVVVDATQLAGAGVVDTAGWGADAMVTSGYKWLSAHGGVALLALVPELVKRVPGASSAGWVPSTGSISIRSRFVWPMTRAASSSRRCRTSPPSGSRHRSRCCRRWGSSPSTGTRGVWRCTSSIGSPSWGGARSGHRAMHRRRPTSFLYATPITIRG